MIAIDRNKLYLILFIACLAGYIWLYLCKTNFISENNSVEVCLLKHTTNIPCPSCGSTRSVISISNGNFVEALKLNPLGYLVALIMLIAPVWIFADLVMRRDSFYSFYRKIEFSLKKSKYAIPLILLIIINWIWNVTKDL